MKILIPIVLAFALVGCRTEPPEGRCDLPTYLDFAREAATLRTNAQGEWHIPEWEKSAKYEILYLDDDILSYRARTYQYTGGAHGYTSVEVGTFDRKTGRKFTLGDVVPKGERAKVLRQVREYIARRHYGLKNYAAYKEWRKDSLFDEPQLTRNFYCDAKSIHFIYNQYEIGCYADGIIEAVVPRVVGK